MPYVAYRVIKRPEIDQGKKKSARIHRSTRAHVELHFNHLLEVAPLNSCANNSLFETTKD
jgi:hypothetical protein